jgi:predicted RNA-binding protein with PIN domain
MSVSASTIRALHQALGDEAADEMIDRMNQADAARAEHREMIQLTLARHEDQLALQFVAFREEMRAALDEFRKEMADLRKEMADFKTEVRADIARLDNKIEQRFADVMRWSLMYWLGVVGSIAALAKILS